MLEPAVDTDPTASSEGFRAMASPTQGQKFSALPPERNLVFDSIFQSEDLNDNVSPRSRSADREAKRNQGDALRNLVAGYT